jgi:hypothetical protein
MMRLEERDRYWLFLPTQQRFHPSGCAMQQARLPGRTPATQKITVIREFGKRSDSFINYRFSPGKSQDTFPMNMIWL